MALRFLLFVSRIYLTQFSSQLYGPTCLASQREFCVTINHRHDYDDNYRGERVLIWIFCFSRLFFSPTLRCSMMDRSNLQPRRVFPAPAERLDTTRTLKPAARWVIRMFSIVLEIDFNTVVPHGRFTTCVTDWDASSATLVPTRRCSNSGC